MYKYKVVLWLLGVLFLVDTSTLGYIIMSLSDRTPQIVTEVLNNTKTINGPLFTENESTRNRISENVFMYNVNRQNRHLRGTDALKIQYVDFLALIKHKKVTSVTVDGDTLYVKTQNQDYITENPNTENFKEFLLLNGITVGEQKTPLIVAFLQSLLPWLIIWCFYELACNKLGSFSLTIKRKGNTESKKDSNNSSNEITFDQIEGIDEVKSDFETIIDCLKNPDKYLEMGAKPTNGIILEGPPGTGKTMLAKAIANEAGVPFYTKSGSDFVEKYVGVGAKRVRDLFSVARKNAPCIIFIDEIDAIGKQRNNGLGGNDEREGTLNQILTEMDGFTDSQKPIIVIAATNRADLLDNALTRPGRFDRTIGISLPDKKGRVAILKIHSKNKRLGEDVDFEDIAAMTVGFSGAELAMLMNESAVIAVREKTKAIYKCHIDKAFFQYVMKGKTKETQEKNSADLKLTAYHEAGHALVSKLITKRPISKVTILSTTSGAGGVTIRNLEDNMCMSKEYLKNEVMVCYGGRVGEMILYNDEEKLTTGASQDIKQATNILKKYITSYGMSDEIGMLNVDYFMGNDGYNSPATKETLKIAIDLAKELYKATEELLFTHKDKLIAIAECLLEKETIVDADIDAILYQAESENRMD